MMELGFIGQELHASSSTAQESTTTPPTTSTAPQQQLPTYVPVDSRLSDADAAHKTILVGLLIALVAASVALGGLAMYCLRRRAQRRLQSEYQAELRAVQQQQRDDKDDEGRA